MRATSLSLTAAGLFCVCAAITAAPAGAAAGCGSIHFPSKGLGLLAVTITDIKAEHTSCAVARGLANHFETAGVPNDGFICTLVKGPSQTDPKFIGTDRCRQSGSRAVVIFTRLTG